MANMFRVVAVTTSLLTAIVVAPAANAQTGLTVGQTFIANGTDATKGSTGWALTSHGISENLFTVDRNGDLVPELAQSAERLDDQTWNIKLAPGRRFSDGSAVTAQVLAASFAHTMTANPAAKGTAGMLTFQAVDPLTLKVSTERAIPRIEPLFAEWALVVYQKKDDGSMLFTGPYAVADYRPDVGFTLKPNPHFPGAAARSEITLRRFGDAQTMALAFEAGQLDLAFGLPTDVVARLKAKQGVTVKSFPVAYQYMAWLNTRRPMLADVKVRKAIDLAFDRGQIAQALKAGSPATGAYAPYFAFAVKEPRPRDIQVARTLLDQAGWTLGTGGRAKGGVPLAVTVLAYPQRPDLVTMLPVIKAQLQEIGIAAETRVIENVNAVAASGDFDMLLWAQHTAPSGDPAFFLNGMLRTGAGLNYSGYSSPAYDGLLDALGREGNPKARAEIAVKAQKILFDDAPVSFLITPEWHVGLSERLADYAPWGSDYHVLRADMGAKR